MNTEIRKKLIKMFVRWSSEEALEVQKLPGSGSYREYIRIYGKTKSAIGTFNEDYQENQAFLYYSEQFYDKNLNVPQIYLSDLGNSVYLQEDLGDITLYQYLSGIYQGEEFPDQLKKTYKKVLKSLPQFQVTGAKGLDFSYAYPRHSFDKQSMM